LKSDFTFSNLRKLQKDPSSKVYKMFRWHLPRLFENKKPLPRWMIYARIGAIRPYRLLYIMMTETKAHRQNRTKRATNKGEKWDWTETKEFSSGGVILGFMLIPIDHRPWTNRAICIKKPQSKGETGHQIKSV